MTADDQRQSAEMTLAAWVRDHAPALRGYFLGVTRRADVADDLTQEVFARAWRARDRYQAAGRERAYLLRIADRLAIDRARHARKEINLDDTAWREIEPAAQAALPLDSLARSETARDLATALDQLTPSQTRVLLLRFFGELTFQEIAESLDCPLNTVLSHCHRGLAALRQLLAEKTT